MAILKYIGRRLLVAHPGAAGHLLGGLPAGRIAPGGRWTTRCSASALNSPRRDRADMRAELGLDRPLPVQYLDWLGTPSGGSGPLLHRQQGHRPGADDPAAPSP